MHAKDHSLGANYIGKIGTLRSMLEVARSAAEEAATRAGCTSATRKSSATARLEESWNMRYLCSLNQVSGRK